jgi:hypothetical protein
VALPIVLLGFLPEVSVAPAAWVSNAFPFAHAVRLFESSLYDLSPWGTVAREAAWLTGLLAVFAAGARLGVRRLLT